MLELLKRTGVSTKGTGDKLTADDINAINSTVNKCVEYINKLLVEYCDVNFESGNYEEMTLGDAIKLVPVNRRSLGMRVKYLDEVSGITVMSYAGKSVSESEWSNVDNWSSEVNFIDGGTFEV